MADTFDPRVTPARADLAASHLEGRVNAARFVEGKACGVGKGRAGLHARPDPDSEMVSEVLKGDVFTVYESVAGMVWGQMASDGYVGYLAQDALGPVVAGNARVSALMTPLFSGPDLKAAIRDFLPLNACIAHDGGTGDYLRLIPDGNYVYRHHVEPLDAVESDFVAVAERFQGVPYVWGGKTFAGLDCSGLVQTALAATGVRAPRDTDMMAHALGHPVDSSRMARGDLVFWEGHVGVVLAGERFLHANAFFMQVTVEPLTEALARNESLCGPITIVRRL